MSSYYGNISGVGHHIGDHGSVRNTVGPLGEDLVARIEDLIHRTTTDGPGAAGGAVPDQVIAGLRQEIALAQPDRGRLRRLVEAVRDTTVGGAAAAELAEQILRLLHGA